MVLSDWGNANVILVKKSGKGRYGVEAPSRNPLEKNSVTALSRKYNVEVLKQTVIVL